MANIGDIQHNLKTGADSELYFAREVTSKASADYGKIVTKKGVYKFPYLTRMTGESIKGSTETIESNELRKGRTASKKRLGNESAEGNLDFELSPTTFDDNLAAAFRSEWRPWISDNDSPINLKKTACNPGEFLTRCIVELGKDQYGNWGADYNDSEEFTPRLLLNDGTLGKENGLITVPAGSVVHELVCGSEDIKYDVLKHIGGVAEEDIYQEFPHMAINTFSLDVQIGSIVTGSFGFTGTSNPKRLDENETRKAFGYDTSARFEDASMNGNKYIDNLPDQSTDTDQFVSTTGNLWLNGKNITHAMSLSMELNNNLERKNAIFVKKAIATTAQKLDITGDLRTYVVFDELKLYNLAVENKTNELMFVFQDKEVNPEFMYLFQIFKSSFDAPDSSASGTDTFEDSMGYSSFEERAVRVLRIALPKIMDIGFEPATTWTDEGKITIRPNVELTGTTYPVTVTDKLKKADGTLVAQQTMSEAAVVTGGTLEIAEAAFSAEAEQDVADGVIREISVKMNDIDYSQSFSIPEATAPADVTGLTVTPGSKKLTITWADPTDVDFDHVTVSVTHGDSPVETDVFENVGKGVMSYTAKGLTNGTEYTVTVKAVDTSGNASAGATETGTPAIV